MGAVDGGVWRSTDYGVKWNNISDGTLPGSSNSIGAIAVAPSDPRIIYVGTGESDIRGDLITGDGVFRSDDAGKTWHVAGLAETHTISAIVVDPKNPDVLYAAMWQASRTPWKLDDGGPGSGLYKSSDGATKAHVTLAALEEQIGKLVQLKIQSSEGSLLHPTRLRSQLAYLAADIDLAYDKPTPAQYQVFDMLDRQAQSGEKQLRTATAQGRQLL